MSEDFRTKLRAFEDRREREHTDPEPIELQSCRHCDEDTEPVNTREILTKSHGGEVTKALLEEFEGFTFSCGDCARPYDMPDHVLLDLQDERITFLEGLAPALTDAVGLARGTLQRDAEILRLLIENLGSIKPKSQKKGAREAVSAETHQADPSQCESVQNGINHALKWLADKQGEDA